MVTVDGRELCISQIKDTKLSLLIALSAGCFPRSLGSVSNSHGLDSEENKEMEEIL